jgi:hypothetical protein
MPIKDNYLEGIILNFEKLSDNDSDYRLKSVKCNNTEHTINIKTIEEILLLENPNLENPHLENPDTTILEVQYEFATTELLPLLTTLSEPQYSPLPKLKESLKTLSKHLPLKPNHTSQIDLDLLLEKIALVISLLPKDEKELVATAVDQKLKEYLLTKNIDIGIKTDQLVKIVEKSIPTQVKNYLKENQVKEINLKQLIDLAIAEKNIDSTLLSNIRQSIIKNIKNTYLPKEAKEEFETQVTSYIRNAESVHRSGSGSATTSKTENPKELNTKPKPCSWFKPISWLNYCVSLITRQ